MTELPSTVHSAAQARHIDQQTIAAGTPGYDLMCRAGEAVWQVLRSHWPQARTIVALAGAGNNGGDGYVLARLAHEAGFAATLLTVGDHSRLRGEAAQAAAAARGAGAPVLPWQGQLPTADLYVDALFGIGLNKAPQDDFAAAITALNASGQPVLALDIPSGLNADTGATPGPVVLASVTLTFIVVKMGLLTGRGPACCGRLLLDTLAIPDHLLPPVAHRLCTRDLLAALPPRARDGHKGSHGHTLLIGGAPGMGGAISMAAQAAARAGSGLVSVATHPDHTSLIIQQQPEIMAHGVTAVAELAPLLERATVVVVGPGLGQGEWGRQLLAAALASGLPLVVDADALNLLAQSPAIHHDWVLTPHPGEAARLLGRDVASVQGDRPAAVRKLQQRYGGVAVLKGAGTLIAGDTPSLAVCTAGNPGMGSGGMGDILAGVIGALRAQGLTAQQAAEIGVLVHALAGDDAAQTGGERGLQATDLLPFIRRRVNPS